MVTADPPEQTATKIVWERPALHAQLRLPDGAILHVINLHLKSRIPTEIPSQKVDAFTWKGASAWAEGSFISAMKRMGQALEVRRLVDQLFDADENALIAVCGDLNANADEVPLEALRGDVENTNNPKLSKRVLVPCESSVRAFALLHPVSRQGPDVRNHILSSRALLAAYQHRNPQRAAARRVHRLRLRRAVPGVGSLPVIAEFQRVTA